MSSIAVGWKPVTLLTDEESDLDDEDEEVDDDEEEEEDTIFTRKRSSNSNPLNRKSSASRPLLKRQQQTPRIDNYCRSRDRPRTVDKVLSTISSCYSSSQCIVSASCTESTPCTDRAKVIFRWSGICCDKSVPATSTIIFFLLFVAFPVHFVDFAFAGIDFSSFPSLSPYLDSRCLLLVCFYSSAIFSAILSPLTVHFVGFKWTVFCACAGVMTFTLTKLITIESNFLLQSISAFLNGLSFGASLAAFRTQLHVVRETASAVSSNPRKPVQIFSTGTSTFAALHASTAISVILWLILIPHNAHQMATDVNSRLTRNMDNMTSDWQVTSYANDSLSQDETRHQIVSCGPSFRPYQSSYVEDSAIYGSDVFMNRVWALVGCYAMCAFGALLLSVGVLENSAGVQDGQRQLSVSSGRDEKGTKQRLHRLLVDNVIGQWFNCNCRLLFFVAFFLGSQQIFMYYIYLQAFPGCYIDHTTSIMVGLSMAIMSFLIAYPVSGIFKFTGRVKLVLSASATMMSLTVAIIYWEIMSRVAAIYFVACLWSVCDCCFQLAVSGLVSVLSANGQVFDASVYTTGYLSGQLLMFLIGSWPSLPTSTVTFVLLGLTLASTCSYLVIEISIRLEEQETKERLTQQETETGVTDTDLGRGGVPRGSRTSQYYRTKAIPERFDNPDCFQGYDRKEVHPMYRTTNADYGGRPPSVHTMPVAFHSLSQEFTKHLGQCGMYRNHSFNCDSDKSRVPEF